MFSLRCLVPLLMSVTAQLVMDVTDLIFQPTLLESAADSLNIEPRWNDFFWWIACPLVRLSGYLFLKMASQSSPTVSRCILLCLVLQRVSSPRSERPPVQSDAQLVRLRQLVHLLLQLFHIPVAP